MYNILCKEYCEHVMHISIALYVKLKKKKRRESESNFEK